MTLHENAYEYLSPPTQLYRTAKLHFQEQLLTPYSKGLNSAIRPNNVLSNYVQRLWKGVVTN